MSENHKTWTFIMFLVVNMGFMVLGASINEAICRRQAIKRGYGEYRSNDGIWQWVEPEGEKE